MSNITKSQIKKETTTTEVATGTFGRMFKHSFWLNGTRYEANAQKELYKIKGNDVEFISMIKSKQDFINEVHFLVNI